MRTLVFGAGNLLLSDEGFGVHFVRYLEARYRFPPEVELLDAGTHGLLVTHKVEEADYVCLVDAIQSEDPPGSIRRYEKRDFLASNFPLKLSPHQAGLQDMLLLAELRGRCPERVVLWGVVPASLAAGVELSPAVQPSLQRMAEAVVNELRSAGVCIVERAAAGEAKP
jgi:hydrogenase maturation protease